MRRINLKLPFPNSAFFLCSISLIFSASSQQVAQEDGEGGCSQFITCLCCSLLLTLSSSMGSHLCETVLHRLLQCQCSSSKSAPVWIPSMGCSPSRTPLQRGLPVAPQVLPANLLLIHGVTGHSRSLLQNALPTGLQSPSGSHGLQLASLPQAAAGYLLHH